MRKQVDIDFSTDERHHDLFTAQRLGRIASRTLGHRFSKVARKCLQCNFGRGDDLNDPLLQEGAFKEVVFELEDLERGFQKLGLD